MSGGKIPAILAKKRVIAFWKFLDKRMGADEFCSGNGAFRWNAVQAIEKVFANRSGKNLAFLRHRNHLSVKGGWREVGDVHFIGEDAPLGWRIKPLKQFCEGAFPRPCGADDCNDRSLLNFKPDVIENRRRVGFVTKPQILKAQIAFKRRKRGSTSGGVFPNRLAEPVELLSCLARFLKLIPGGKRVFF